VSARRLRSFAGGGGADADRSVATIGAFEGCAFERRPAAVAGAGADGGGEAVAGGGRCEDARAELVDRGRQYVGAGRQFVQHKRAWS